MVQLIELKRINKDKCQISLYNSDLLDAVEKAINTRMENTPYQVFTYFIEQLKIPEFVSSFIGKDANATPQGMLREPGHIDVYFNESLDDFHLQSGFLKHLRQILEPQGICIKYLNINNLN